MYPTSPWPQLAATEAEGHVYVLLKQARMSGFDLHLGSAQRHVASDPWHIAGRKRVVKSAFRSPEK